VESTLPQCGAVVGISCTIAFTPGAATVPVVCGGTKDTLTLLPDEKTVELRLFADWTFIEAFFQWSRRDDQVGRDRG